MPVWLQTFLDLLSQFTGGRGGMDHIIVDFAIAAVFWGILLMIANVQHRTAPEPRDALLRWGFGVALGRELFMLGFGVLAALHLFPEDRLHIILPPLEHALSSTAQVIVGAGFMRFLLPESRMAVRYLRTGVALNALCYLATFWWWGRHISENPASSFGQTWCDWIFHINATALDAFAAFWIARHSRGQIRNVICGAFMLLFLWDGLKLPDMALGEAYENILHPISHLLHLAAIPLFGYVYVRELATRRAAAEREVGELAMELDARVVERTSALKKVEAVERARTAQALRLQHVLFDLAKEDKSDFDLALRGLLRATGDSLETRRVSFWAMSPAHDTITCRCLHTHGREAPDTKPLALHAAEFPAYFRALGKMTQIVADDAHTHEATREFTGNYLIPLGITSLLDVPVWSGGGLAGILCCEHVGPKRAWTQPEMDFATAVAEMIALANERAERRRAEEALRSEQSRQTGIIELESAITGENALQGVLDRIAQTVTSLLPAGAASVVLWDASAETFNVSATTVPGQPPQAGAQRVRRTGGATREIIDRRAPVIMPDVSKDPHTPNALLEQFGMKAYAGVPLLADGVPLGVLYAIDREVRQYSERDIGFLTAVASRAATAMVKFRLFESLRESNFRLAGEVAERRLAQQEISASLREKEVMLQEIHHRVKNNLQIVSSLLNLQARDQRDPALREAFADSQQRIRSMALIHEMLYQSDDLAKIDFAKYLRAFIPVLLRSYGTGGGRLTHNILADDIALSPETAVPLGLIVNELVTNSIKHAFPDGRAGRITIECRNCEGVLSLSVGDDGAGLPADFSPEKSGSLGMRLVAMLSKQLAARLEMRNHDGTAFLLVCTLPGAPAQP